MPLLDDALAYLAEGRSVFPVLVRRTRYGFAKQPLCGRPREQRFTEAELRQVWPESANAIGMECGKVSGVIRIDAEGPVPWHEFGDLPTRGQFTSVSGGTGWLVEYLDGATTTILWKGGEHEELRIQSDGAFTVVPPSEGYSWLSEGVGKVPSWVHDFFVAKSLEELTRELRPTSRIPDKEEVLAALQHIPADDYDEWCRIGMALKTADMLSEWIEWSKTSSKFTEGECERKWETFNKMGRTVTLRSIPYWAERFGYKMPNKHEPVTELGFAKVLANIAAGNIAHSTKWGWLSWDGTKWDRENAPKVVANLQKQVLRDRTDAAIRSLARHLQNFSEDDEYKRKKKAKLNTIGIIRKHEAHHHIVGARRLAESEPLLSIDHRLFDQYPMMLNCANGIIDLRSSELLPHSSAYYLTQICPTKYLTEAECPRWLQFLEEVFNGDSELIRCMHRFLGYCITGSTEHHILPIWYGTGRNGKSTLVKTILHVLGSDYSSTVPSSFLAQSRGEQHPTKLVELYGKRFTADLETDEGMKLNEELLKRITGGDEISARRMREDFWTFKPTHKLILATNHEPSIRNQDVSIWGRLRKIPFNACFLGREEQGLEERLRSEAEGILRWMVEGCVLWQQDGLMWPKSVEEATEEYRGEQNTVKGFLEQMVVQSSEHKTRKNVIIAAYKAWCLANSLTPLTAKAFGMSVAKLGVGGDSNYYHLQLNR